MRVSNPLDFTHLTLADIQLNIANFQASTGHEWDVDDAQMYNALIAARDWHQQRKAA